MASTSPNSCKLLTWRSDVGCNLRADECVSLVFLLWEGHSVSEVNNKHCLCMVSSCFLHWDCRGEKTATITHCPGCSYFPFCCEYQLMWFLSPLCLLTSWCLSGQGQIISKDKNKIETDSTCICRHPCLLIFYFLPTQTGFRETQMDMGVKGCILVGEEL